MTSLIKKTPDVPAVLHQFAAQMGTRVIHNRIEIPKAYGYGYCTGYKWGTHLRMLILNYSLKRDMFIENADADVSGKMLLFKLQQVFTPPEAAKQSPPKFLSPSFLIATRKVETALFLPVHTHTGTVNIEIDTSYLSDQLASSGHSPIISRLLENDQPLVFEQMIYPDTLPVIKEIIAFPDSGPFRSYFMQIKAEELVCRLLCALEKRTSPELQSLNQADIRSLYQVRGKLAEDFAQPPRLSELAIYAGMSVSKLKTLFRQIFGKPVYAYYNMLRMQEAARLLKEKHLSVSETGYALGFSNLSHFSRLFEQHMGLKPKKYAMQQ